MPLLRARAAISGLPITRAPRYSGVMLGSSSEVRVRKAKPADAKALAAVFRESWLAAYRGIIPHVQLETTVLRRGTDWWVSAIRSGDAVLVMEVAGTIAGYATCGAARGRRQSQGEIYELYLSPPYQGLGLGAHLFEACRYTLDSRRFNGLIVWSLAENTPAIDFYWRRGGRPVARSIDRFGTAKLPKIAFAWS